MAKNKNSNDQWVQEFKKADKDKNGFLSLQELKDMLRQGNCNLPDSEIEEIFVYFDGPKGDRKITLDEFVKGMKAVDDFVQEMEALFSSADTDKSGFLDKNELRKLLSKSNRKFTDAEVDKILKDADTSGDGKISLEEFINNCS